MEYGAQTMLAQVDLPAYPKDTLGGLTVTGTLRVIDHPARRIGLEIVPPWIEIRVSEK
jgi:hypothetical protein